MNPLDYVLIGVLLFFLITGYIKGFLAQFLQILAIVGSFLLASRFYLAVAENDLFEGMREHSLGAAQVTAWIGVFLCSGALLSVLASFVAKRFQNEHLRLGDRWLGALLSTAKGAILLGGIALGLQEWKFPQGIALPAAEQRTAEGLVTSSVLVPRLADACFSLVQQIPARQREALRQMIEERRLHLDPGAGGKDPALVTPRTDAEERASTDPSVSAEEPMHESVLMPFGELRRLSLKEREGPGRPYPSSAKEMDGSGD